VGPKGGADQASTTAWSRAGSIVTLSLLAACTSFGGSAPTTQTLGGASRTFASPTATSPVDDPLASATLVWTQGGLPPGFSQRVALLPGVEHSVAVVDGTVWLTGSMSASGEVVDHPPSGMAIPLDLGGAKPADLSAFLPTQDRNLIADLDAGQAILGTTSARLRRLGRGGVLEFGARRVSVAAVVPDRVIGAHELFVSRRTAGALGIATEQYVLIQAPSGIPNGEIRRLVTPGTLMRIRGPGEAHFLRQADAVLPPVMMKAAFGEFAASPQLLPGEWLRISSKWQTSSITTSPAPVLGTVRCNRALIPQLRAALGEVQRRGLASLVHTGDYGGCFAARIIPGSVGEAISAHTWGAAIDINVSANEVGAPPHQDPRLVAIFRRWGFTWGGRWMRPDGMHFEFQCFPPGMDQGRLLVCPPGGAVWPSAP
jgi:hypothetical protein